MAAVLSVIKRRLKKKLSCLRLRSVREKIQKTQKEYDERKVFPHLERKNVFMKYRLRLPDAHTQGKKVKPKKDFKKRNQADGKYEVVYIVYKNCVVSRERRLCLENPEVGMIE